MSNIIKPDMPEEGGFFVCNRGENPCPAAGKAYAQGDIACIGCRWNKDGRSIKREGSTDDREEQRDGE